MSELDIMERPPGADRGPKLSTRLVKIGVLTLLAAFASAPGSFAQSIVYYHVDMIGSVRAVTDASQDVIERHDYYAYGEECVGGCPSNPAAGAGQPAKFTGKERDVETGLDYFGARYYRSGSARFGSVDPVLNQLASIPDPQRWNRYAYARNNPWRYLDPDGRDIIYADDYARDVTIGARQVSPGTDATLRLFEGTKERNILIGKGKTKDAPGKVNMGQTGTAKTDDPSQIPTDFVVVLDVEDIERTNSDPMAIVIHEVVGHVGANLTRSVKKTQDMGEAKREQEAQKRTVEEYKQIPKPDRPQLPPDHKQP